LEGSEDRRSLATAADAWRRLAFFHLRQLAQVRPLIERNEAEPTSVAGIADAIADLDVLRN
jgi:hypothetical protein